MNPAEIEDEREREALGVTPLAAIMGPGARHDPWAAMRQRDFRLFFLGRFVSTMGSQMVNVAIGWDLYLRTHSALALGFIGLAQMVPLVSLALPAGFIADRVNRKAVMMAAQGLVALCALGLALLAYTRGALPLVYLCLFGMGVSQIFNDSASSTMVPTTVPPELFENAATWNSSAWQLASVVGPALGGFVIAWQNGSAALVYVLDVAAVVAYIVLLALVRGRPVARSRAAPSLRAMAAGVGYVRRTQVILAAITLDMFAVLLGGATTLLPIYATDILHVGATGLGWLRAAPSIGAVSMALCLAFRPPFKRAGRVLLLAVAAFGLATIVFGVSRNFWLSLAMLALLGAMDNVSVVVRATLLLLRVPDELRGRIAAINSIFVGTSNELGGFESGLTAALFGPVVSVAAGGVGTLIVVALVALIWPEMRRLGRLAPPPV
jgi:MFS family permease